MKFKIAEKPFVIVKLEVRVMRNARVRVIMD